MPDYYVETSAILPVDPKSSNLTNFIDQYIVIPYSHRSEINMNEVKVSPKYQVVIPKEIRESMGIYSGQKIQMIAYRNRIELIPLKPMKQIRGFLKGLDTEVKRDKDRL